VGRRPMKTPVGMTRLREVAHPKVGVSDGEF
jgi:hypothetical protein